MRRFVFPTVPTEDQWAKLPGGEKAAWLLLGSLQITGISLGLMTLLFAH